MINPNVWNAYRSECYIAFVLDEVVNLCSVTRLAIESAVKVAGNGSINTPRYFLKKGVTVTSLSGLQKEKLHKRRCCSINKKSMDANLLQEFEKG